ncbi:MAG: enoyl-CoA hydratase/isomerase family protein [Deltaproteobacteria bacterium]|nr:enoyl-CoA hydratase/isomerase family protein [Deltaproteobacteria bacterium]
MATQSLASGKVLVETGPVTRIQLTNPAKRNSLDAEMAVAVSKVLDDVQKNNDVRVVIFRGAGDEAFCSGYDIAAIPTGGARPGDSHGVRKDSNDIEANELLRMLDRVEEFPLPTVAILNGHAYGAGAELAVTCDFRLAASHGKFSMPPARLGICYHPRGIKKFIDLIGAGATRMLFLAGEPVTMEEALRLGLVSRIADRSNLDAAAETLIQRIAANAPLAVRGMKKTIRYLLDAPPLDAAREQELKQIRIACFLSEDLREGQRAFIEKRQPVFQGK